jgi:hypothetical protein
MSRHCPEKQSPSTKQEAPTPPHVPLQEVVGPQQSKAVTHATPTWRQQTALVPSTVPQTVGWSWQHSPVAVQGAFTAVHTGAAVVVVVVVLVVVVVVVVVGSGVVLVVVVGAMVVVVVGASVVVVGATVVCRGARWSWWSASRRTAPGPGRPG